MLELIFIGGSNRGQVIRLTFDKAWFGRQQTCDYTLLGGDISLVHFSIERRGDEYVLVDNKSSSGTFVNGVRVETVTLRAGDDIVAGSNEIEVRTASAALPFRFVAERRDGDGTAQIVKQDIVLLGRKSFCPIQLNDPAVAAVHAELEHRDDGVWITDESSGAGIYVNGHRAVQHRLRQGDVVTIGPFEITISLNDDACSLLIQDRPVESRTPSENLPPNYRDVVVPPLAVAEGQAKPSASITALPHWMRAKAPIWVPTSDILPNRFRSRALLIGLIGVVGWAAIALAAKWNSAYTPGSLSAPHATLGCESCHSSFKPVSDSSCQTCHSDKKASDLHQQIQLGCAACHSEHRGAGFDIARDVGSGCQAAGCHVTVHEAEKSLLARQAAPQPGLVVPKAVAFAAHFEAGDKMHDKHANLQAACAACHTDGDPAHLDGKQPQNRIKEQKAMRMKCLGCHGFGPEATLRDRCYSCHLEHPSEKSAILTTVRFPDSAGARANRAGTSPSGLVVLIGAIVAVPLFIFAATTGGLRVNLRRFKTEAEQRLQSAPSPAPVTPAALAAEPAGGAATAAPKPTDNQSPSGHLRPKIDMDLCVGCGTCVHVCPFNVLEIVNEKAIAARLGDCTGYAACVKECPTEAIIMVPGGAMQTMELPIYNTNLETNIPRVYLAGEVTGKALIKIAINQGKQVVESLLKSRPDPGPPYDVIVVGAGPAGTSAALAALKEGFKVLVLEQGTVANTIRNYPRQKFVMAEPVMIPVYGPLWMEDTSKEALLERWEEIISSTGLVIQQEEKVLRVAQNPGHFLVQSTKGEYQAASVILAIGKRGSPRKLGVPGEDTSKVAYNLIEVDSYRDKAICIVGGGDSGIEASYGLARQDLGNRVSLVHRADAFAQAKPRNQKKIKKYMDEGRVKAYFNSALVEIRERSVLVKTPTGVEEIDNDFVFVMVGGENPKKFLTECGIEFSQRPLG